MGILAELAPLDGRGEAPWAVIGMGVNLTQTADTFRAQGLEDIAVSLAQAGYPVNPNVLTLALLERLDALAREFPACREDWLERYRARCLTPGRRVSFERDGTLRTGTARKIDGRFALLVDGDDGTGYAVSSGTVKML